jgi:frataxin-like iron-binding protein CyaY
MASTKRRYSKDEFARRGDTIYEKDIRPQLTTADEGKFAAIDIESGSFELDADELTACDKLNARVPDAQIWLVKVGSRYVHRFGGRE